MITRSSPSAGISLDRLNEIMFGNRGITPETALRLARYLKTSPQLWMHLCQANCDLHRAQRVLTAVSLYLFVPDTQISNDLRGSSGSKQT